MSQLETRNQKPETLPGSNMKYIIKFFQFLYSVYAFILFVVILILLMPVFFVASFFGKTKGGNIMFKVCGYWADVWLPLLGIRPSVIHEAKSTEQRPCIFVANHGSYMDIPMTVYAIRENIRPLGKAEMSKIPLFGFLYRYAVIMVQRDNPKNRATSVSMMKKALKRNISIIIFPEGTFNMTAKPLKDFYDGAFRIAIETQTPLQPVLFVDASKRLPPQNIFSLTPGVSRAIYLAGISVDGLTQRDVPALKKLVYDRMEEGLIKYGEEKSKNSKFKN